MYLFLLHSGNTLAAQSRFEEIPIIAVPLILNKLLLEVSSRNLKKYNNVKYSSNSLFWDCNCNCNCNCNCSCSCNYNSNGNGNGNGNGTGTGNGNGNNNRNNDSSKK